MARADRGPLLSSLVLVGLATVATAALVLIGVQAGKISFSTDKSSGSPQEQTEDGNVIGVDPVTGEKITIAPSKKGEAQPSATTSTKAATDTSDDDDSDDTPVVTRTTAPTGTKPKPTTTTTTATSKPTATSTTATTRPSPKPSPSQTTATTRPSPSPTPSPTCTAVDRSGKCKQAEPQSEPSSNAPAAA